MFSDKLQTMNIDVQSETDTEFFGNLEKSKLEELFNFDSRTIKQESSKHLSLKVCPTQYEENADDSKQNWITVWARVAYAYEHSIAAGKVGVALLKNLQNLNKIIIYKTKRIILSTRTINKDLNNFYKKSNYIQFYDDDDHFWSLLFDKKEDEQEFKNLLTGIGVFICKEDKQIAKTSNECEIIPTTNVKTVENTKQYKNCLLERISKVGQQLPLRPCKPYDANENSDSSDTEITTTKNFNSNDKISDCKLPILQVANTEVIKSLNNYETSTSTTNSLDANFLHMLLSENRSFGMETHKNITKLDTKIDKILDKVDFLNIRTLQPSNKDDQILDLEEQLLSLKKEKRRLLQMLEKAESEKQERSTNCLKTYEHDFSKLGISLKKDISQIVDILLKKINALEIKLQESESANIQHCQMLQKSIQGLNEQNVKVLSRHCKLEQSIHSVETTLRESIEHNQNFEQQLLFIKQGYFDCIHRTKKDEMLSTIKIIMNNFNFSLCNKLKNIDAQNSDQLLTIIGQTIKEETLKTINELSSNQQNCNEQ